VPDRFQGLGGQPSRRRALVLGGGLAAAAGASLLVGCSTDTRSGQPSSTSTPRGGTPGRGSVIDGGQFLSQPDLRPPGVIVTTNSGTAAPGVILLDAHGGHGQQGPMILDRSGDLVWFKRLSANGTTHLRAFNLRVQAYRGEPLLTWWQGAVVEGHGEGHYVLANSRYEQVMTVYAHGGLSGDLHEFLLTDAGNALFTCFATTAADLRSLHGAAKGQYFDGVVQEVELATAKLVFEWRANQHIALADSYSPMPSGAVPWDPYHVNSISVAPDGNLVVSSRNTWTVFKINRSTGAVLWRMGGKHSDFAMGPHTRFAWQHHVTAHKDGIFTIFDNEAGGYRVGKQSRGLVLHVDEAAGRVSFVRQFNPPVPILSGSLGSVQELPDGHVLVGWGEKPYFTEYRTDGSIVFDGRLTGTEDYRAFKSAWTGRPADRPAVAIRGTGQKLSVYVSWNGDTEVRSWHVLAGPTAARLTSVASASRGGFETKIDIRRAGASYLAVAGYDSAGRELGRSAVQRV
jgi:Arylsulfotransferase (ASST)